MKPGSKPQLLSSCAVVYFIFANFRMGQMEFKCLNWGLEQFASCLCPFTLWSLAPAILTDHSLILK